MDLSLKTTKNTHGFLSQRTHRVTHMAVSLGEQRGTHVLIGKQKRSLKPKITTIIFIPLMYRRVH